MIDIMFALEHIHLPTYMYIHEPMQVVFRQGELLSGVLDKSQFGASQFGFVHSVFEVRT